MEKLHDNPKVILKMTQKCTHVCSFAAGGRYGTYHIAK